MKLYAIKSLVVGLQLGFTLAIAATPAWADKQELPKVTEGGLHLLEDSKAAVVYVDPDASLLPYTRVMLLDTYVAFKKNWERDQRHVTGSRLRISDSDILEIKKNLADEFQVVFADELNEAGYPVVTEAAADVLLLRPAIINLDVNAPDIPTSGRSRTYVESAGEMTLYIEMYDSVTGDIIAKAMDARADKGYGGAYTWANTVTNRTAARRILKDWAELLVDALNEAKEPGNIQLPDESDTGS